MSYEEFKTAHKRAKKRADNLTERLSKDPLFKLFHNADTSVPKDSLLTLADFKPETLKIFTQGIDVDLLTFDFNNSDLDKDHLLSFEEFKSAIKKIKTRKEIEEKLKDPLFAIFYSLDLSGDDSKS